MSEPAQGDRGDGTGSVSRQGYFDQWSALHGGVDPSGSRVISGYLSAMYLAARPFVAVGASPNAVTLMGLVVAACAPLGVRAGGVGVLLAVVAIAISGLLDGVDGAVAVITGSTSSWGAVLDSVVDRMQEAMYLLALYFAGAPGWLCVAGGATVWLSEYARARAGASGMTEIGVVTPFERPTRIAVAAMFLLAGFVYQQRLEWWASAGAWVWFALALASLVLLLVVIRRRLSSPGGPGEKATN